MIKRRKFKFNLSKKKRIGIEMGFLGFIITVVFSNLSSKNINESFKFNPLSVVDSFSSGFQIILGFSHLFTIFLGWIFLFLPSVFIYFLIKWSSLKE